MSVDGERVRELITQEAADWFVGNRAGLGARERHAFASWLKASPVNVEEYLALSLIARDLRAACEVPQTSIEELVARARREEEDSPARPLRPRIFAGVKGVAAHRWQTAAVTMAVGVLSVGLLAFWSSRSSVRVPSVPAADALVLHFETRHGEQQTRRLADNSVLHLNTDSSITIRYSKQQRLVVLAGGEAEFEVAHEPQRPFRVFAGSAEVIAVGTRFDVRLAHDATVVTVSEGRVAVGPAAMAAGRSIDSSPKLPQEFVQLGVNQQISVTAGAWPVTPIAVDAQRTTAWLNRQIMFEHEPLERVAGEFNRYSAKPIEIATPALRNLEISGVFATDDSEAFIAFLRSLEGVRVEVTETRIRVSQE